MTAQSRTHKAFVLALALIGLGVMISGLVALQFHLANDWHVQKHLQADAQKRFQSGAAFGQLPSSAL